MRDSHSSCVCRAPLRSTAPPSLRPLGFFLCTSRRYAVRSLWRVFIFLAPSFFIIYPTGTTEAARHFASVDTRLSSLRDRMSLIQQAFDHYTSSVSRSINLEKKLKSMEGTTPPPPLRPPSSSTSAEILPSSRPARPPPPSLAAAVSSSLRRQRQQQHPSSSPSLASHRRVALDPSPPSSPSLSARRGTAIGTLLLPRASSAPASPLLSRPKMITGSPLKEEALRETALRSYRAPSPTILQGDGSKPQQEREVLKTRMLLIRENFEQRAARATVRNLIEDQWQDLMTSTAEGFPSVSSPLPSPRASPFRKSFSEDGGDEDSQERQLFRMADKLNQMNYHLELDQATRLDSDV